jgi:hypothetical protein
MSNREPPLILVLAFHACLWGGLGTLIFAPLIGIGMLIAALILFLTLASSLKK